MNRFFVCTDAELKDAPEEIKVIPLGKVKTTHGDFLVDSESVKLIINKFKERKIDIVIDYEHQTLLNVQAPAGGWIKELYVEKDAIMAKVEWTNKAKEYLRNREYRYLSPVVFVRKSDNRAVELQSVALTNTPAINGMFSINKSVFEEEETVDLKLLAKLLGMPETATEDEIKQKIQELAKLHDGDGNVDKKEPITEDKQEEIVANATILGLLGLNKDAKTEDVTAKIMSLKTGEMNVEQELKLLKQSMNEKNAEDLVEKALSEGKITPAQKEWAKSYALSDKNGFEKFIEKAPVVVPIGKTKLEDAPQETIEYDKEILKNCGLTEEDVKKYCKVGV